MLLIWFINIWDQELIMRGSEGVTFFLSYALPHPIQKQKQERGREYIPGIGQ